MAEEPAKSEIRSKKRLAVFLDGTWNAVADNTNVWRLESLCAPVGADGVLQLAHYRDFAPTLWTVNRGDRPGERGTLAPARPVTSVEQRWFVGAHANVAGGYHDNLLGQIQLRWMMRKASLHGFGFTSEVGIDGGPLGARIATSYDELKQGHYARLVPRLYRPIGAEPATKAGVTESTVNETIDASLLERWRAAPEYRPKNLADWGRRRGVDVASLDGSVQADDPGIFVPD